MMSKEIKTKNEGGLMSKVVPPELQVFVEPAKKVGIKVGEKASDIIDTIVDAIF